MSETASPRATATTPAAIVGERTRWRLRSRWLVHLGLLASGAGALVTLQFLHIRIAIHSDVGLAFCGLVVVHLVQRRRTIIRWSTQLIRTRPLPRRLARLFSSDALLAFIALNVLVSGVIDWGRGQPTTLPLPQPFDRWHLLSGAVLVAYAVVHLVRRRGRLRRSTIQ